jgi:hypothetical protein
MNSFENSEKLIFIQELRNTITCFFQRAEELSDKEGNAQFGDERDQAQYRQMIRLLENCGVDMTKWEALEDAQVGVLEMIQEGADPAQVVEIVHQELSRER